MAVAQAPVSPASLDLEAAQRVHRYARAVATGEVVVGDLIRRAGQRHLDDLERAADLGWRFDEELAGHAIRFFPMVFRHYKGEWGPMPGVRPAGLPIELEDWEAFFVGCLFGWLRRNAAVPESHPRAWLRRFGQFYLEVAKKNGKTLLAAGVANILTFFDGEPAAEGYFAATKREQAALPWRDAREMVRRSLALRRRLRGWEPKQGIGNLWDPSTSSFLKPLSAEEGTEEGINPHNVIVDELHRHRSRGLVDMLRNSMGARAQPVFGMITTAGEIGESIWAEEHDYAAKVVQGVHEADDYLVLIYTLDEGDDPFNEAVWPKANPNLGVSVRYDELRTRAEEAKASPAKRPSYLRLRMNVRSQPTAKYIDMKVWDANTASPAAPEQSDAWGGLDLGWSRDISTFGLWVPDDGYYDYLPLFWMPEESAELRRMRDRIPYHTWAEAGLVKLTEGNVRDDDALFEDILELCRRFDVRLIRYDRAMASNLVPRLKSAGLEIEPVAQGFLSLSAPTKELDRLLARNRIRHGGHEVLRWMASNVTGRWDDNNNVRLQKPHGDSPLKVDGISGMVNAISAWIADVGGEVEGASVYETRGLLSVDIDGEDGAGDDEADEDDDEPYIDEDDEVGSDAD